MIRQSNSNRVMGHSSKDVLQVNIISKHEILDNFKFSKFKTLNSLFGFWVCLGFRD